ncbi:hypothetical protein [Arthrobacter psychrolactophilus]
MLPIDLVSEVAAVINDVPKGTGELLFLHDTAPIEMDAPARLNDSPRYSAKIVPDLRRWRG